MTQFIAVFIGGGLGSLARFGIEKLTYKLFTSSLPIGTLLSNIVSTLILAIFFYKFYTSKSNLMYPLLAIGFCGGFSTFSTFSFQTFELLKQGFILHAIINILLNLVLCILVLFVAYRFSN